MRAIYCSLLFAFGCGFLYYVGGPGVLSMVASTWIAIGLISILYFMWRHGSAFCFQPIVSVAIIAWPVTWVLHWQTVDEERALRRTSRAARIASDGGQL